MSDLNRPDAASAAWTCVFIMCRLQLKESISVIGNLIYLQNDGGNFSYNIDRHEAAQLNRHFAFRAISLLLNKQQNKTKQKKDLEKIILPKGR